MADTYTLISSVTVGAGGAASISFSSIPSTYTDLKLVYSVRSARPSIINDGIYVTVNGLTTNIYTTRQLQGDGASAASYTYSGIAQLRFGEMPAANVTANTFGNGEIYIPNYTGSAQKSFSADHVGENNATTIYATLAAGLSTDTGAITSISIVPQVSTFVQYSTAYLYGIKNS